MLSTSGVAPQAGSVASAGDDGRICVMHRLPGPMRPEKDPQIDVRVLEVHGSSYVRALAWCDGTVLSGGWDGEIAGSQLTDEIDMHDA